MSPSQAPERALFFPRWVKDKMRAKTTTKKNSSRSKRRRLGGKPPP